MNAYMPSKTIFGFLAGVAIGTLGGLIGLGGAEFRLPLLIGLFSFPALEAVMLNKAMSLVVVGSALPFRAGTVSWEAIAENWHVVLNILAGSMAGGLGASWATVLRSDKLYRVIALLLVAIAAVGGATLLWTLKEAIYSSKTGDMNYGTANTPSSV